MVLSELLKTNMLRKLFQNSLNTKHPMSVYELFVLLYKVLFT